MAITPKRNLILLALAGMLMATNTMADTIEDPCSGLLNIVNRPSFGDSACVVPSGHAVIEAGYQYLQLSHNDGSAYILPQGVVRAGLPFDNELVVVLPTYVHQSRDSVGGSTATTAGIKHEIGYNAKWIGTVESLITQPNGSAAFGSQGVDVALNGIANYNINQQWGVTFMLGLSTETLSSANGGGRFTTVLQDVVLSYAPVPAISLYAEAFGFTKTAPNEGSGYDVDGGIIYLIRNNMTVDLEYGHRISGELLGITDYVGAGFAVMF